MDNRIGYYDSTGSRVLPEHTITGKPVKRPVTNTINLVPGYFAVLDEVMSKKFPLEEVANTLRQEIAALTAPVLSQEAIAMPEEVLPAFDVPAEAPATFDGSALDVPVTKRGRNAV